MRLRNETPFDVKIQIAAPRRERLASVIIKSTYDWRADGRATLAAEQMPLITRYLATVYGVFHGEMFFKKQGADVCVLGTVKRSKPVTQTRVHLAVGARRFTLDVWGDRVWQRAADGQLRPSAPVPFTEMPLSYERALGGHRRFEDGSEVLFANNPSGRGHYVREDQAENQPLPNLEVAGVAPLRTWSDVTPAAGWGPYPSFWGLRAAASVDVDVATQAVTQVRPSLFNHAHPDLVLDALPRGELIRLDALTEEPLQVRVPEPPAQVSVQVGSEWKSVAAPLDGVFLWCDDGKVVVTQRARFAYVASPEERREVRVNLNVEGWS